MPPPLRACVAGTRHWPEVLKSDAGLVVPCDADATAQALRTVVNDPVRSRQMGSNGRRWVAENLPWDIVGAQMVRVYEEIVRDHRASQRSQGETPGAGRVSFVARDK